MKDKKHSIKLQKSSGLFMQLGLVLTLAIVYMLFEHKTEINKPTVLTSDSEYVDDDSFAMTEIKIERKQKLSKDPIPEKTTTDLSVFEKVDDASEKEETDSPITSTEPDDTSTIDIEGELVEIEPEDPLVDDTHLINFVEEVPVFPGCEKGDRAQQKKCFEKSVGKFINRKFNADIASQLGLSSGKQRIMVQFKITKSGAIEIMGSRAAHKRLEKEGERVVGLLPKMQPGKQNGKEVNVTYMVPIVFDVQ